NPMTERMIFRRNIWKMPTAKSKPTVIAVNRSTLCLLARRGSGLFVGVVMMAERIDDVRRAAQYRQADRYLEQKRTTKIETIGQRQPDHLAKVDVGEKETRRRVGNGSNDEDDDHAQADEPEAPQPRQ